ncbi:hypothetical protein DICSQDRAFT_153431 [Dichomitus squalens LYAD-421 SS1]|uniref:uncharacterized protein n=1 Tax=Dichomitus squalens (strain LYAD-421) TaxID=732165 RepID=UPI0004411EC3|nr:uncharacterized protein DICSQDRAFT_153431 [Dichomitus squalens LYAD-421 SS1]EJF64414.1 hypothetical protein DICSQDRAFT_153431 [Dichomitus squalens LYAD-421 SS1]
MPSTAMDIDSSGKLDAARALQAKVEAAKLNIVEDQTRFDTLQSALAKDPGLVSEGVAGTTDPAVVAAEVASQISFLRNLKFQYLEQKAKDQYVKTIVSDEAPNINADDNELLRIENDKKKEVLAAAKARLAEKYSDVRTLAPLVEQDYNKARVLTQEASALASKILDARLTLTRLRQAHPHPRLTIPAANAKLDEQIEEMQALGDELEQVNAQVEEVKEKVKAGAREVERLRVERADLEKTVSAGQKEVQDGRVVGLYDWCVCLVCRSVRDGQRFRSSFRRYTAALALHRSLLSLESAHSESENELHLTYNITPRGSTDSRQVFIKLLFVPNSRQLADAQVEGLILDVGDVIGAHVQANDVPRLIAAVLSRARAGG